MRLADQLAAGGDEGLEIEHRRRSSQQREV
jgi:hypothetical protein